ncbi:MAG: NADPH:quinone oxidoreductase family protein [Porticoccaceae bacterium]
MKALICEQFAGLDQLKVAQVADPVAAPGQVVVDIAAAGVNFPDGLTVQGLYQSKPPLPFTPGTEICGRVAEVGEGVKHLKRGDRVIAMPGLNGFAEKVAVDARLAFPCPDVISDQEAAGLLVAHATAHHALRQRANLQPGETLLVTGAAGGTGLAAVQIGKAIGAKVIAVCSTQEKLDIAKANGADVLINYSEKDLKSELKAITEGRGVDVVYECVGGETFDACVRNMAWNGRLLVIGFAGGTIPSLPANLALVKGFSLVGVFWGAWTQRDPQGFMQNMQELIQWYSEGKVKVVVDQAFPLDNAVDALKKVMSRKVAGKVVITP